MNVRLILLLAALGGLVSSAAAERGFVSLFNGMDLSGWKVPEGDGGHWKVADGVIDYDARSEARGQKHLWSEQSFGDFRLHVEWRIKETPAEYTAPVLLPDGTAKLGPDGKPEKISFPNADSGILFRGVMSQANIWCWPVGSGELWSVRNSKSATPEMRAAATPMVRADHPVGRWNAFDITLVGNRITIELNGRRVIENALMPELPARGPIGFQHHGGLNPKTGEHGPASSLVQFRNIWIKELPEAGGQADADGYRPLLDDALSCWLASPQGDWTCADGELSLEPAVADGILRNHNYIWTKAQFDDFDLEFDVKFEEQSNSGLFFRCAEIDDPVPNSLEVQLVPSHGREPNKGGTLGAVYSCLAPAKNAALPAGEWNRCRLVCQGPNMRVHVNDELVTKMNLDDWSEAGKNPDQSDNVFPTALKHLPRRGHIGFQDHGRKVRFRNIRVKRL